MSWLERIFGNGSNRRRDTPLNELADAISRSLVSLIVPQLQMLDLEPGGVPADDGYFSKRSRGYILGIVAAVLHNLRATEYGPIVNEAIRSSFSIVYGPTSGNSAYVMTVKEVAAGDPETVAASDRAERDVTAVYAGEAHSAVVGFWLLNNGIRDQAEVIPALPS